jgi:diguanylate cyclase (GGDEF)-like protein/PAS domain S-box-containing protein
MINARRGTVESAQQENRLDYDKLTFFYMSLPYMLVGQLLGALLLAALMYGVIGIHMIGIWLLMNAIIFVYRIYHYRHFKQSPENEKLEHGHIWLDRYYTDVLVSGLVWGSTAFMMFPSTGIINQVIVMLFLITMGFTSMGVLASKRTLLLTYVMVVFLPIIVRLFFMDESLYQAIAFSGLALVLLMTLAASYYGDIINKSLAAKQEYLSTRHSYQKLNEQFFSLFERAPVGIFHFDDNLMIEDANAHFLKMTHSGKKSDVTGKELKAIWPDDTVLKLHERVLRGFGEEYQDTLSATSLGKQTAYVNLSSAPMHDDDGNVVGGITIINDITPEIRAKEELARFMHYDTLTDLPNRTLLLKHVKMAVDAKLRTGIFGALLFLDIDHFNNINRSYGQKTGDIILKKIAVQLEKSAGKRGTVARIGADTFAILLPVLKEDREESKQEVLAFITQLRMIFEKVMVVAEADYHIGFTIGVALFDTNTETPLEILKHAESTMFGAKNGARGTVRFYEKDRDGVALNDIAIANDIYKAIKNNEFTIFYQPQQDIHSGILTGAEALVRWNHPKKGSVSPAHFIPLAEESGAIIRLEEWIFEQIFKDMRTMANTLIEFPLNYIAVNVSSLHFLQPNFVDKFVQLVHKHRINPLWVNIEITESGIMSNIDEAISRIHELKRLGFGFSIDDFGTGYSSLTYLKKLPVDIIKIDRSFVKDADRSEEDRLIVESVIEISRKFGFKVLAEGIDRQETLDYFKGTACKTFQGYLYYKPISMDQFLQLI